MTYNDMLRIAMEQSAEDLGCKADDFTKTCLIGFVGALFINENIWYLAPMGYGFGLLILCIMRLHKE